MAARGGHKATVEHLVKKVADINITDINGVSLWVSLITGLKYSTHLVQTTQVKDNESIARQSTCSRPITGWLVHYGPRASLRVVGTNWGHECS